ncbi:MAG: hypothetical protein KAW09_09135, partial [Thermoplasmata archaeon]|nr:hypothetical protein [Thermoplasmata archaeon]
MIRQLVAKLLRSIGCAVSTEGGILTATRGDAKLVFGFPIEEELDDVLDQIAGSGGQGVVVPLFDGFSEENARGIPVMDRKALEDDVVDVLLGKKRTKDTVLGNMVSDCLGNEDFTQEAMVRPTLAREDVVEIGGKTVDGFNYILDLVPYFVFEYNAAVEENGEVHESQGTIAINALTRAPEQWSEDFEMIDGLEYFDRKQEPKTDEKDAFQIAQKRAVELGTVVKERVKER